MHWTAAPAVPLVRLSTAPTATRRPARSSTVTWRWTAFEPSTAWVCGHWPGGSTCTNGSSAYALRYAARASSAVTPGLRGAEQVARMPRGIGHEDGREGDADRAAGDGAEVLLDLGGVPVHAADAVGADVAHHLGAEQVGLGRLAGAAGAGRGDHDDVGLDQARGQGGDERERRDGRVAARDRDPLGAAQRVAGARQLGEAVGPGAGVLGPVEPRPGLGVGEPEVRTAVDDEHVVAERLGDGGRRTVRKGEEDDVVTGQHVGGRRLEDPLGERGQVGLQDAERAPPRWTLP